MQKRKFLVFIIPLAALLAGCASMAGIRPEEVETLEGNDPKSDCPVTANGASSFEPPASSSLNSPLPGEFWFGSKLLWTSLPSDGVWAGLPKGPDGYTQKIFWWSTLFSLKDGQMPALVVSAERLDAKTDPLKASRAKNAFAEDIGSAMLVGVDFPAAGCWKVTGQYKKASLDFVVWIAP